MKQKHQIHSLLQQHFTKVPPEYKQQKIKLFPIRKIIYQPGDPLTDIFLIIKGQIQICFLDKEIYLPQNTIIGDYEAMIKTTTRVTTLVAIKNVQLIQLPYNSYSNMKPQSQINEKFISKSLWIQDTKIQYLLGKLFKLKSTKRGQEIIIQQQNNQNHIGLIKTGCFNIKKYINIGIIKKLNIQLQKQFTLSQISQCQIIRQNITCYSTKGQIFICNNINYINLINNFQFLQQIFSQKNQQQQYRKQRYQNIKKICQPKSILMNSILPSIFHTQETNNQQKITKIKKNKTEKHSFQQSFDKNHFFVQISNDNQIITGPTNSNLSLIPIAKIRKYNISSQLQPISLRQINTIQSSTPKKNITKQQNQSSRYKTQQKNNQQIPQIFDNKFKRKMFIKTNNPFHHFKSKLLWFQSIQSPKQTNEITIKSQRTLVKNVFSKKFEKLKIQ